MTDEGDKATVESVIYDTGELSSRQLDAARILATSPNRSKESIAKSLKISRRTIFRWLADDRLQKKIEEFRRSKIVANDAKSVLAMLSVKDKQELLTLLLEEKENRHLYFPEIEELERKIMEIAESDDLMREKTKKAVETVELLVGRLKQNALFEDTDYKPDGRQAEMTASERLDRCLHAGWMCADLKGEMKAADAFQDLRDLVRKRMDDLDHLIIGGGP